jgi:hypothetical protein
VRRPRREEAFFDAKPGYAEVMPDFHLPDDADRHDAEATGASEAGLPDLGEEIDELRERRASSRHDPNRPDRPLT